MRFRYFLPPSLLLCSASLLAQSPAAPPPQAAPQPTLQAPDGPKTTLSVNARLVTLPVVVRDKKGKIVPGLTKDDFVLTEDGRAETIRYFNLDTNLPLTLALNVDTSGSMRDALDSERTASQSFLDDMLAKPEDKAAVLHFDREVELLEDLTPSKPKLREALNQLGPTPETADNSSDGSSGRRRGGGTQLYDSIYLSANDLLAKQSGRKAIIVMSDGEDRGSKETLSEAVEAAQKAEAEVYTIYFKGEEHSGFGNSGGSGPGGSGPGGSGPGGGQGGGGRRGGMGYPGGGGMGYPGGGGGGYPGGGRRGGGGQGGGEQPHVDGKKIMQQIADETGGRFFEAKKKENFDAIYKEIAEELRQQYMLGYTPDGGTQGEGFHRISLAAKKKDLYVQTRAGYYGRDAGSSATQSAPK